MSVNTAHANNGVLIHVGEYILLHSDGVTMDFSGQDNSVFRGSKTGRIYLTSHRMIFNNKKQSDEMQSFSAPFIAMSDVELEQPVFGANYIKGKVRAQPNGNFVGEVKFKLHFKAGGAIEYGQALLRAASSAQSNLRNGHFSDDPPPYTPSGAWHEAPPPAYQPPPGYYGWLPTHSAFSGPAPNTVFMSDHPPPYPGIGEPPAYAPPAPQPAPGYQPQHPVPGFQMQQYNNDAPSWNGFSAPPPEQPQAGACGAAGQSHVGWGGYQPPPYSAPTGYGAPGYGVPGYGTQLGYPQPPQGTGGNNYSGGSFLGGPQQSQYPGTMGFSSPQENSKEAEAMASAYNTPFNQRGNNALPSDMPPAYNDIQPRVSDSERKNQ